MTRKTAFPKSLGRLSSIARTRFFDGPTPLEAMPNLTRRCGGPRLFVKRDDFMGMAFGGNKVRQLEFYLGEARERDADCILITGAVQSNFARLAAAGARKLGMECHIQLEERVRKSDAGYRNSGNVLLERMLGATLHSFPEGENEGGADRQLGEIADDLRRRGRRPYIIPLAPGHPPLGALGYVVAAHELLRQIDESGQSVDEIVVASGGGNTHAGLLFGLRALGSDIVVRGICVRRDAAAQTPRIRARCREIAGLLGIDSPVDDDDVVLDDAFLATFATIHPGITEREIHSRLIFECLQRGAGWAHGILNSNTNPIKYGGEGDTVFQSGNVVHTDYVAYLEGYPGHQNRNAIVGAASAEQLSLYAEYRDVYLRVIAHCQPGVTAGEVHAYSIGEFEKRGWVEKSLLVGHSVGAWWHQQEPILTKGSEIVLEEGMVLAVEPHLDHWSIQDLIVVRAGGPELLSDKFRTEKPFITG
ncbi:MAG: pyridoxal-phosphate dependent enzyme [SAR324 cluster bacterium]|nr:pyridoxal-phosphate dependent enzyme [SAR324 cluster bacterium]